MLRLCQKFVLESLIPNFGVCVCVCVGGLAGSFTTPVSFPLITKKLYPWKFAAFSNILLETFLPNLVSLTRPSLQILRKTQTGVFPISRFLVNPL